MTTTTTTSSTTVKLKDLLYRCIAITAFVCVLVVTNLFYQLTVVPTQPSQIRIRTGGDNSNSSSSSSSEDDNLLDKPMENRTSMQLCYHFATFNRTEFMKQNGDNNYAIDELLHPQQLVPPPKIIWLMSFPNSGTTFTLKYVQGSTMTTTATNYGGSEQVGYGNTSISIYNDQSQQSHHYNNNKYEYGPFLRYPDRPYSCHSILTKTHCHQDATLSNNMSHFINSCRMGNRNVNGTHEEQIVYDTSVQVHSVIHLIRNPLDNIVARMHYKYKQWLTFSNSSKEHALAEYVTFTPEGFLRWCQYIKLTEDKHYYTYFNSTFWATYMEPLPCAIEFYKYFHWHHYTTESTRTTMTTIHNPSMILYYEDYSNEYNATTNRLLHFLQLERSSYATTVPEFIVGKTYTDWFTNEMKENVKRLALVVVSDATWKLLHHYFH